MGYPDPVNIFFVKDYIERFLADAFAKDNSVPSVTAQPCQINKM